MRPTIGALLAMAACVLSFALSGCGGAGGGSGSSSSGGGGFQISIKWPTSRDIPSLTDHLQIAITDDKGNPLAAQTVQRPTTGGTTSTIGFKSLPADVPLTVTCTAFAKDAGQPALGFASTPVTLIPGPGNVVILNLQSTIDSLGLFVDGATSPATDASFFRSGSHAVKVTAFNAAHEMVLIADGSVTASQDTNNVTISGEILNTFILSGSTLGTTHFTFTEAESKKQASLKVSVVENTTLASVKTNKTSLSMIANQPAFQLMAKAYDVDGGVVPATITFSPGAGSSGFSVGADGTVTATAGGSGTVVVTATSQDGKTTVNTTVPVTVAPFGSLAISMLFTDPTHTTPTLVPAEGLTFTDAITAHLSIQIKDQYGNVATPTAVKWNMVSPIPTSPDFTFSTSGLDADLTAISGITDIDATTVTATATLPNGAKKAVTINAFNHTLF